MPATALDHELQAFTVELFERSGGVADWPEPDLPGSVVIPPELAASAHLPGEEFSLAATSVPGGLQVGLAGEFLDVAARLLDSAVPREGRFCIPDRYLTSRDLTDKIGQTFGWQNARAKCQPAEPALVEYHLWTLFGSLRSEEVWESIFRMALNAESQAIVELPDVFAEPDVIADGPDDALPADASLGAAPEAPGGTAPLLKTENRKLKTGDAPPVQPGGTAPGTSGEPFTYAAVVAEGKRRLIAASAEFVHRIEQRLERDKNRLHDYYRALSREAGGSKRRATAIPSADEVAAKKRAVDLELRRKLAELNENYALRATLRPVVLARVRLPALVVPVVIQRKQAFRDYRLYWNSLLRKFEPLSCSRCHRATFKATFTNDSVDLLCAACAGSA
jgi:hypothetical protein